MSKYPIFRHYLEDEDDKPYYTMNSLSFYYEDMERKQKLIESLAKSIAGYDIRLTDNLEAIEQEVDRRLADWDKQLERFPDSVEGLLMKWSTDGTIDTVIQTALIDEKIAPVTAKLADTEALIDVERTSVFSRKTNEVGQKAVVFVDDDVYKEVLSRLDPVADEKNFKFSMACITGWVNEGDSRVMTWDDIHALKAKGHEVLSHSVNHLQLANISLADAEFELRESKKDLLKQGINAEHFVYPGGSKNRDIENLVRKYYKSALAINGPINYIPLDQYNVRRYWFDSNDLAGQKAEVDKLVARESGLLIYMLHAHLWSNDGTKEQELRELVDYIRQNNLEIKTYGEAFENFGNIIDIGGLLDPGFFKVDPTGNIHSPFIGVAKNYTTNELSFSTPPSFFEGNGVSIASFNLNSGQTDFPESQAGLLVTFHSDSSTIRQYWYPYNVSTIYTRRRSSASAWTAFSKLIPDTDPLSITVKETMDFGSIPAHSTKDLSVAVAGVQYGRDVVSANPSGSLINGIMYGGCTVATNNQVTIRLANVTASAITVPSTQSFRIRAHVGTKTL